MCRQDLSPPLLAEGSDDDSNGANHDDMDVNEAEHLNNHNCIDEV